MTRETLDSKNQGSLHEQAEPQPAEPERGPPLPELPPQPRLRTMVRDPETTFVYWEGRSEPGGWEVLAEDREGRPAAAVRADAPAAYVHAPVSEIERVTVRPLETAGRPAPARSAELPWAGAPRSAPAAAPVEEPSAPPAEPAPRWRAVGDAAPVEPAFPAPRAAGGAQPGHTPASSPPQGAPR